LSNHTIFSICEDAQGRVLAGTLSGGVNVFDRNANTFRQVMKGNSQTEDFWPATDGTGAIRYDSKGNKLPERDYISDICDLSKN
jgi:hypothetical protein